MLVMRCLQNVNAVVLIGGLVLCLVFMMQIKQIYNSNQKYNRFVGYKQYINEISTEMRAVENSVNKSAVYVHQLNKLLLRHSDKNNKGLSSMRVSSGP